MAVAEVTFDVQNVRIGARDRHGVISLWDVQIIPGVYDYQHAIVDVAVEITNQTGRAPMPVLVCIPGGKQ